VVPEVESLPERQNKPIFNFLTVLEFWIGDLKASKVCICSTKFNLREEQRLVVLGNKVLRRASGSKKGERVDGESRRRSFIMYTPA
jgi:hypothetical protein